MQNGQAGMREPLGQIGGVGRVAWQRPTPTWPDVVESLEVELAHTALLVIDLQYVCASADHGPAAVLRTRRPEAVEAWAAGLRDRLLPNVQRLLAFFRDRGLPVLHTRVGSFLPDAGDLHRWRREALLRPSGEPPLRCAVGDPLHAILPAVRPAPGEPVFDKNAASAFVGSPIDFALRGLDIRTLIVCGVATHACVQHTARDAADLGYNVVLVADACASSPGNEAAHARTLRVFGRVFGAVKTTADVLAELAAIERGDPAPPAAPAV